MNVQAIILPDGLHRTHNKRAIILPDGLHRTHNKCAIILPDGLHRTHTTNVDHRSRAVLEVILFCKRNLTL